MYNLCSILNHFTITTICFFDLPRSTRKIHLSQQLEAMRLPVNRTIITPCSRLIFGINFNAVLSEGFPWRKRCTGTKSSESLLKIACRCRASGSHTVQFRCSGRSTYVLNSSLLPPCFRSGSVALRNRLASRLARCEYLTTALPKVLRIDSAIKGALKEQSEHYNQYQFNPI